MDEQSKSWLSEVPIEEWVETYGTPMYVYSLPQLRQRSMEFREAFGSNVSLFYAMKANPNIHLVESMKQEGLIDGVDIASPGEWAIARKAGWSNDSLSYTGPGKRRNDIQQAIHHEVGTLCVESVHELRMVIDECQTLGKPVGIMIRLNPPEAVHAFGMRIAGLPGPFGMDDNEMLDAVEVIRANQEWLQFQGVHMHAGSQCFSAKAYARSMQQLLHLVDTIEEMGLSVPGMNVGGGLGLSYWTPQKSISVKGIASHLRGMLHGRDKNLQVRMEPGRWLLGPAGAYISRVVRTKESYGKHICITDGGIHHHYEATLSDLPTGKMKPWIENLSNPDAEPLTTDVTGCLCTTRDRLGRDIPLPSPKEGDLLAWPNMGAYGMCASPILFLGHPTPLELLYDGENVRPIRRRYDITEWTE